MQGSAMIVDPTPQRSLLTFVIAGCIVVSTVVAAAMALSMFAPA